MASRTVSSPGDARVLVAQHLARPATGWAIGLVGAVAEFTRSSDENAEGNDSTCMVTARGGLRIEAPAATRVVRFTLASGLACIALCLPQARARLNGRAVLSEIGRDYGALRPADHHGLLFDLGVQSPFFDFCIRTADGAAVRRLRQLGGRSLFGGGPGPLSEIAAMQPHRIARSKLGRIEVYQPIAAPDASTPDGPHTHLLPDKLAAGRTFDPVEPIPGGWIPCAHLYVGHLPAHDEGSGAHGTH